MSFSPAWFHAADMIPLTLLLVAGLYAVLGLYGWHRRESPVGRIFTWLMAAMAVWSLGYGMEVFAGSLPQKIFWAEVEYPGIAAAPVLWLAFALEYTGRASLLTRRRWIPLSLIPLITVALFWTNESHRLIWSSIDFVQYGGLILLAPSYGPMFWVNVVYSYALILLGSIIIILGALRAPRLYRSQAAAAVIAASAPVLGNALYVFDLLPVSGIDPTPFVFLPSGLALAWAITRYRFLDLFPPAQSAILDGLADGILLLDRKRRVLFMNEAAERIFGKKADECLGQAAERVCAYGDNIIPLLEERKNRRPRIMNVGGGTRQFEIHVSPMRTLQARSRPENVSHLVILRDVTERQQAEEALRCRDDILRAVSLAAEQFLTSAWEEGVPQVLERLGTAAEVSRVYIFERHLSEEGVSLVSQRFEWAAPSVPPQIDNPNLQNLDWIEAGFSRWEEAFQNRRPISGRVRDFPPSERALLEPQEILSIVIVPIFLEKELWGFIGFDDCLRERDWSEVELDALSAAAGIFSAALERRKTELRLLKRQRTQNLLQEIIRAALREGNVQATAQILVDHLGSLIRADYCFLARWDDARQQTIPFASFGFPTEQYRAMRFQPGEKTFTQSVLEAGHLLVAEDVFDSPYVSPRIASVFNVRSLLAIPMTANEKKLGAVLLGFSQPHRFTSDEIIVGEQATELISLAFARSDALEESQRRADEADTLRRAGATVAETLDLREATTRILEQLAFVLPHDSASIQLLRGGELEIIGGEGWDDPSRVIGIRFPVHSDNPNSVVIETRKPYLLHEADKIYPAFRRPPHDHIHSWLGVPLIVRNELIGLLAIDGRDPFQFTPDNIELVSAFAGQVAVAIENARLFDAAQQQAITDGLTGLYNRRHFMELARNEFERARRYKRRLSIMMFDIDHFKIVNDTYGHPTGDQVLRAIANLCREKLREADPIARYGGEEFIALIVEARLAAARRAAERLRAEVEKMVVRHEKGDVRVTVSVGVAELTSSISTLDALIARVDQAMYAAKRLGRNRVAAKR